MGRVLRQAVDVGAPLSHHLVNGPAFSGDAVVAGGSQVQPISRRTRTASLGTSRTAEPS